MKDNLEIAKVFKKTILYLDKIVLNFPRTEKVLKNNIDKVSYEILELIYFANELEDRAILQKYIIAKVKMLDFYITISKEKGYISYKKYEIIGNNLIELVKKIRSWIKT